jgi:hypothetical protein
MAWGMLCGIKETKLVMNIRKGFNKVIIGIVTEKLIETCDKNYDENVVVNETGLSEKLGKPHTLTHSEKPTFHQTHKSNSEN